MYPNSNIWIIGHSLGGALASLLGGTFGTPVVAFESPAEKMAASRLHLPSPVRYLQSLIVRVAHLTLLRFDSHLYNISRTYTTPRILYPWAPVMVFFPPVRSQASLSKPRQSLFLRVSRAFRKLLTTPTMQVPPRRVHRI